MKKELKNRNIINAKQFSKVKLNDLTVIIFKVVINYNINILNTFIDNSNKMMMITMIMGVIIKMI